MEESATIEREQILSFMSSLYGKEAKNIYCYCLFIINMFLTHVAYMRNVHIERYACAQLLWD